MKDHFARRSRWLLGALFPAAGCAALVCGCQRASGPARVPLQGTVTRGGALLAGGMISFRPAEGRSGPAATTTIRAGRFQFDVHNGPTAGPHQVMIVPAGVGKPTSPAAETAGEPPSSVAAPARVFEIDVPNRAADDMTFDVP